jgi:hypothetical protein
MRLASFSGIVPVPTPVEPIVSFLDVIGIRLRSSRPAMSPGFNPASSSLPR